MAKEQTPTWVKDLIAEAKQKAGNAATLAKKLQISQANFVNYDSGTTPSIQIIERLLKYLGGDIKRALPGYEALDVAPKPKARLLGQVQAGAFSPAGDSKDELLIDLRPWCKDLHSVGVVEVIGDSMMPRYSPGQMLVCKQVRDHSDIRDGTPCIFLEHGENTFKLLRRLDDGQVIAQPINCDHKLIPIKGRSVRIQMVVIGSLDMGKY